MAKLGVIDESGEFLVSMGGQKKIFTHFKDLYVNRVQFEGIKKPVKQVEVDISGPKLSKKTAKLAQNHREKIAATSAMAIEDFLLAKHEHKTKQNEAKAATLVSSKVIEDQLQSTFKPKIINF